MFGNRLELYATNSLYNHQLRARQSAIRIESKAGLLFDLRRFFLLTLGIEFDLRSYQLKLKAYNLADTYP